MPTVIDGILAVSNQVRFGHHYDGDPDHRDRDQPIKNTPGRWRCEKPLQLARPVAQRAKPYGRRKGWKRETIDAWNEARPGSGRWGAR